MLGRTRRRTTTPATLVAGVLLAAVLSACSSSGHSVGVSLSSTTTKPGTHPKATTTTAAPSTSAAGGGTTTTTAKSSAATVTKASFLAAANAVCKDLNAKNAALSKQVPSNATAAQSAAAIDQGADGIAGALAQIQRLPQPPGDRTQLVIFYRQMARVVTYIHQLAAALRTNDANTISSLESGSAAVVKAVNAAANAYGLTSCAQNTSGG
jgi:hypothetical protein